MFLIYSLLICTIVFFLFISSDSSVNLSVVLPISFWNINKCNPMIEYFPSLLIVFVSFPTGCCKIHPEEQDHFCQLDRRPCTWKNASWSLLPGKTRAWKHRTGMSFSSILFVIFLLSTSFKLTLQYLARTIWKNAS